MYPACFARYALLKGLRLQSGTRSLYIVIASAITLYSNVLRSHNRITGGSYFRVRSSVRSVSTMQSRQASRNFQKVVLLPDFCLEQHGRSLLKNNAFRLKQGTLLFFSVIFQHWIKWLSWHSSKQTLAHGWRLPTVRHGRP